MGFIREQIKEKPISKRRLTMKIGIAALCGLVFAGVVCLVLAIMAPMIVDRWDKEPTEIIGQTELEAETEMTENPGTALVLPQDLNLSIESYQALQNELYRIGNMANKSIVTVSHAESKEDWNTEETAQGAGLIISKDGNYIYILAEQKMIAEAPYIRVSFVDGTGAEATLLKKDANTGLAVLTVENRQIRPNTQRAIQVAKLGSETPVESGMLVIALGTNKSILTGNITSVENEVTTLDNNYSIFTTDIASASESGVLINTNGEVIGVIMQSMREAKEMTTLTAVHYTEVARVIENLKNRKDIPYAGVYTSTVTDDISEDYDIPKGIFIREVAMDSPAMKAGLQSGDVITHINGEEVFTDAMFSDKLSLLIPGTTCEITVQRQNGNEYYEVKCTVTIEVLQ